MAIGAAIEAEAQMEYYDKEAPALAATLKRTIGIKRVQSTSVSVYKH